MPDPAKRERGIIRKLLRQLAVHPRSKKLRKALARHRAILRPLQRHATPGSPVTRGTGKGGLHETAGLPGYPAYDWFAPAGSPCVAPVAGRIRRFSGHDPKLGAVGGSGGPLGWTIYLAGDDGNDYFITHMGSRTVAVGQRVAQGQTIGTVANYHSFGRADHIHMGVHKGAVSD